MTITFNPNNGKRSNDPLLYINKSSNHSLQIINQLPRIISARLFRNSSKKEVFNASKGEYEQALKHRGYSNITLGVLIFACIYFRELKKSYFASIYFREWQVFENFATIYFCE